MFEFYSIESQIFRERFLEKAFQKIVFEFVKLFKVNQAKS